MIVLFMFNALENSTKDVFLYLNPFYIIPTVLHTQKYLVSSLCLAFIFILVLSKQIATLINHNEHGSSAWATQREINRTFHRLVISAKGFVKQNTETGGMVIKKMGQKIWIETQALHSLIIGTTSSGKTRKTLIPSIMTAANSLHVINKAIHIKVLSTHKYQNRLKRIAFIKDMYIFNFSPYYFFKKISNTLHKGIPFLNYDLKIVEQGTKMNLKKEYAFNEMKNITIKFDYSAKCIGDENGILNFKNIGKMKVKMKIEIEGESFLANDPKKELYQTFKIYLEEKGYHVILLDMRNNVTGDTWNPMATVVRLLQEGKKDEADLYAKDIANALCPDGSSKEKIWIDGERSVITALILAIASADCDESKKNLYSCYQTLLALGKPYGDDDNAPLNDFFKDLPIGDIARSAFGPASLATDRTRMSFYVSAATTLSVFASLLIAKQTASSSFDITKFSKEKTAVFLVNPDEKSTMNPLATLFVDEVFRVTTNEAMKSFGVLYRRFHFFLDELCAMNPLSDASKRWSISRGRNILIHSYIQDFAQLDKTYGEAVAKTIKANCNLTIYLSTQSYETAEEISKRIGNKTIVTNSTNEQNGNFFVNVQGSKTESLMGKPLMNPNELMNLEDGKAIVLRLRCNPILTTLEDCSSYEFYQNLIKYYEEPVRSDNELIPYIPQGYSKDSTISQKSYHRNKKI